MEDPRERELSQQWTNASEREKRSRTVFAQETIKVDEVSRELEAMHTAIGKQTKQMQSHGAFLRDLHGPLQGRIVHKIAITNRLANAHHVLIHYAPAANIQMADF